MKSGKWSKIARSVAGLTLAAGLAMLTAGCQIHVKDDSSSDQAQDGADSDINQSKPNTPDYSEYSPLLQDVLKSDYYNGIIAKDKEDQLEHGKFAGFNILKPLPFKFLENSGENVKEIINNNIDVGGNTFVKNSNKNELYNYTFINRNESSDDAYRTMFLLKYHITDEEYNDYYTLSYGKYFQASFLFQEIDKTREPELVTKFNIDEEDYNTLIKNINRDGLISENEVTDVFLYPSTLEQTDAPDGDKKFNLKIDYLTKLTKYNYNENEFGSAKVRFPWGCRYNNEIFTFVDASIAKVLENSEPEGIIYFNYDGYGNNLIKD